MRLFHAVLVLLAVSPLAHSQNVTLPAKESLFYTVEWRLITAGKARLDWAYLGGRRGGWEAKLRLESVGMVSKLFKVEDEYSATLNPALCVQSSQLITHEGVRQRETRTTFDAESRKASYVERDRVKNTTLSQEIDIPPCVHDVVGGLYFLRTLTVEPGQAIQIPVSDGKRAVMARVEAQQREEVKTPAGTFKTIRYELFLFNDVLYRRFGHLYVWVTDDARKLPVQIRVRLQFAIGTITLQLEKQQ
jgi:hypothetical protein